MWKEYAVPAVYTIEASFLGSSKVVLIMNIERKRSLLYTRTIDNSR